MKKHCLIWLAFLLLAVCCVAQADTYTVDQNGQKDFETLTEAVQNASAGDTIILCAGVYDAAKETFPILLDKPLSIVGEEGAVLDSPRFTTLVKIVSDDVNIKNVTFDIRKWGIVAAQCSRMTLENCAFILADAECRTSSTAIWMEGVKYAVIDHCAFEGVGICMAGDPLNENSKGKPVLTGLCEVGQDEEYFITHKIENCTVNNKPLYYYVGGENVAVPEDAGGLIAVYCDGVTVKNADVSDSSMGLEIVHSKNVVLENVTADRCGIFGTYVACVQGGRFENVQVHFTNHGIDTRASENITLINCLAEDCDQGIFFSLCNHCITENCTVRRSGFAYFAAVGNGNIIRDSKFYDNADGIYLQNELTTTIENCTVTGSTVVGLRVLKSSCVCTDSAFENGWTGTIVYDSADTRIQNCRFHQNASANLYLAYVRNSEIADCEITGATKAHLELDGTFDMTNIHDCTFSGSADKMISKKGKNEPTMTDNVWLAE